MHRPHLEVADCRNLRPFDGRFGPRCGSGPFPAGGGNAVLTIGKLGVGRGQLEYYDAQVASGAEDYYAGRGESPGRWRGRGAELLALPRGGRVERCAFMRLMQGRRPGDGQVLREMGARSTVAGLDLTFSAPKSVSVLFAIGDADMAGALLTAHERAVDAALAYLEREACFTRRGHDGTEWLRGDGFIAASYRHRMSRAGDPQLHTHVVVGNLTRADGRYTALDARALYEHKSPSGAVYRAVLRAEVRARLPWVTWRSTGRGLFEIDGVPERVVRHFSQRRAEIEERVVELVGAGAGRLSRERMQAIALRTRRARHYGIDGATWREQARARAAEHGLGAPELATLTARPRVPAIEPPTADVAERLSGPAGLTEMHNTFARRHALAEIAGAFAQGATVNDVEAATSTYLAHPSVRELAADSDQARYTTLGLLACERMIVEGVARRRYEQTAVLDPAVVGAVLAASEPALNPEQAAAVEAITGRGRGIDAVTAVAGSGKTTMLGAVAVCYRRRGWEVVGAAPTARAARQLRETAGIPADTMHALMLRVTRCGGFTPGMVLVLDEAGMAPTRLTARLFELAERAGVKVVAVGDPGQLASVQAGGWLAAITADRPHPALTTAIRQHDSAERDALQALHDGDPDAYLEHKRQEIAIHEWEAAAIEALIDHWHDARLRHGPTRVTMIARDNSTRELVNRAARARLQTTGELPTRGAAVADRDYAPGDRVIARQNDRRLDLDNGTLGTVVQIDAASRAVLVETDSGRLRMLDQAYVAEHLEHAYALTAHSAQGGTFQWAGVIGRPGEFTREWAYTALSRARTQTTVHVIAESDERQAEGRDEYAPAEPQRSPEHVSDALRHAMRRSETEKLAIAIDPAVAERPPPDAAGPQPSPLGHVRQHRRLGAQRRGPRLGL